MNELLLIGSVVLIFGTVILAYKLFGKAGLFCVSAIATVLANIEVIILVKAFGMEQTLGNVLLHRHSLSRIFCRSVRAVKRPIKL